MKDLWQASNHGNRLKPLSGEEKFEFKLVLGPLVVGTLRADNCEWVFAYSNEFRNQNEIKPIVDFPITDREYRSRSLWPFFVLRIPSTQQPAVRDFIEK